MATVTFDFHNTLATCDTWFDLEVRSLPWRVHERLNGHARSPLSAAGKDEIDRAYRALRAEVMAHGEEVDALDGVVETFRRVGVSHPSDRVSEAIDDLMRSALSDLSPRPGAVQVIMELHERGHRLGVISSAVYHPFVEWSLERFGIGPAFSAVVTSASAGFYKSRPEIYQVALNQLESSPGSAAHVGDSFRYDHLTARSAGLRTVWLADEATALPEGPAPDIRITSLAGAADAIAQLAESGRS